MSHRDNCPTGTFQQYACPVSVRPEPVVDGRRQRKTLRTREALASAAVELVVARGLRAVTVEEIADRADVTRRTFSRYFAGKETAVLDGVRADGDRINAALRARPEGEDPVTAYRAAVRDWLDDEDEPAWHRRPGVRDLLRLTEREPTLFGAHHHLRALAEAESVRVLAERMGVPEDDLRPAVVVGAGAGALVAATRLWLFGDEELPVLVDRAFDALVGALAIPTTQWSAP
ncbi:TetR family transcriptional regulator [Actinosynnema pretiosum]|uniref:TetR family transcriptional regulator n=1 Tax=Actinosynnema pretiosum TaxID=42197 RepID=A0A290Z6K8_9PSEU|nr:TetR family transcriptional regulator [Actinosynnema pretiosum]